MTSSQLDLSDLLAVQGFSQQECAEFATLLSQECPWFGGSVEVSEEIGEELLVGVLPARIVTLVGARRLLAWHNKHASGQGRAGVAEVDAAYASLVQTVRRFGIEDGLGAGDFWVMEDSLADARSTVMVFKPLPLFPGLEAALVGWLEGQTTVKEIALVNRDGDLLVRLAPLS